jgi:hypothetical protein
MLEPEKPGKGETAPTDPQPLKDRKPATGGEAPPEGEGLTPQDIPAKE